MSNPEDTTKSVAYGVGAALGVFFRLLLWLGLNWVALWCLTRLGWLPFDVL